MRKFFLPIVILFCVLAAEIKAQDVFDRCNRATIESFSEQEKRPVLLYLDESRKAADEFVRLLAEGKSDEIYSVNKNIVIWVQGSPAVRMDLATFERQQGKITDFELRNQDVLWDLFSREIDLKGTVGNWYLLKTTNAKDGVISMLVETRKGQDKEPVFRSVFFSEWSKLTEKMPSWLSGAAPPIEPGNCPTVNGILTIKRF